MRDVSSLQRKKGRERLSLYTKIPRYRERRSLPEHTIVGRLEREGQRWRERERKKGGGGRDSYGKREVERETVTVIDLVMCD